MAAKRFLAIPQSNLEEDINITDLYKETTDFFQSDSWEEETLGISESLFANPEDLHLVESTKVLAGELYHTPAQSDSYHRLIKSHAPVG